MMPLFAISLAACLTLPPGAERITAGDLRLDGAPDAVVSLAPDPGTQRIFHSPELRQVALRLHLASVPEADICVERAMAPLDPAKLLAAMRKEYPEARIEVVDYSRQLAPEGEIVFRRAGLRVAASAGGTWFGSIRYAANREFTIWAKVTLCVRVPRVIALHDLSPGKPIEAGDVKAELRDELPAAQPMLESIEEALGRYPRATFRAGAELRRDLLESAKDVRQGDVVEVEVRSGNAHLKFEARAAGSGCVGETVPVLNPASSKRFQARIEAKGKVSVEVIP